MPASLRFIVGLLAAAIAVAAGSFAVIEWQSRAEARTTAEQLTGGHADAGKAVIARYGCTGCHAIPGITGPDGAVGPPLAKLATRAQIAGKFANTPGTMIRWLRAPQQLVPGNGMPDQGLSDREARDAAAYLYTLK